MNTETVKPPRDFTYIRPRKRRLSEYEAVTCHVQPDPEAFDKQGWYLRTAEGRTAWRRESTRLVHPCWFDFRDPASHWQRTYVRMQAEQERGIERAIEDASLAGGFADVDRKWLRDLVFGHYRTWSFHEYGLFRCFAQAQRETLSDTLGNVFCFEGVDRMRHAQAIVLYVMDLESRVDGLRDQGAKERWLSDPAYQPARRLTEELMAIEDWAELAVAVNVVVDPILATVATSELLRRHGSLHGDSLTPFLISTTERDRRRNFAWTEELVGMVTAEGVPARDENRAVLREWVTRWTPRAIEAAEALAPVHAQIPLRLVAFSEMIERSRAEQAALAERLGLGGGR